MASKAKYTQSGHQLRVCPMRSEWHSANLSVLRRVFDRPRSGPVEMENHPLRALGWKPCFEQQVAPDVLETALQGTELQETVIVARVSAHFGSQVLVVALAASSGFRRSWRSRRQGFRLVLASPFVVQKVCATTNSSGNLEPGTNGCREHSSARRKGKPSSSVRRLSAAMHRRCRNDHPTDSRRTARGRENTHRARQSSPAKLTRRPPPL